MGYTLGDGIVAGSLAAALVAHLYFRYAERQRRLEIAHEERLVAMQRGLPVAEHGRVQAKAQTPLDSRAPLLHAIVWAMLTGGAMLTMALMGPRPNFAVLVPAVAAVLSALASLACEAATTSRSVTVRPAPQAR
jgi:hypothetical protein